MANKTQYFSNTGSVYGPLELHMIRPNSRILVIGSNQDYTDIEDIRSYFDLIISEDIALNENMPLIPDITIWSPGSPYIGGILEFPFASDSLMVVNFSALQKLKNLTTPVKTYNLSFIPDGEFGSLPSVTRGVTLGLDPLASGVHLSKICGAVEIYDSENRANTLPGSPADVRAKIAEKNRYGVSSFYKGPRLSLLERI